MFAIAGRSVDEEAGPKSTVCSKPNTAEEAASGKADKSQDRKLDLGHDEATKISEV
jgi:hypothetical protein